MSLRTAITGGVLLLISAIALSFAARWQLSLVVGGYLLQTVVYSVWLKHEAVLDLACVASGFVLRTIAGGVAVGVTISPWFLIVAGSASLFMVTGKRHAEMVELGEHAGGHRLTLDMYSRGFLSYVRAVASSVTVLAYCLWAFEKSATVGSPVWFELSIVPFVLGILRYALLLEQGRGGAPEELVLSDRVLLAMGALGQSSSRSRCTAPDGYAGTALGMGPHLADASQRCTGRTTSSRSSRTSPRRARAA